jgi:hypothetical protein
MDLGLENMIPKLSELNHIWSASVVLQESRGSRARQR